MLKEAYTTGTHTSAIFKTALSLFLNKALETNKVFSNVILPNGNTASILIDNIKIGKELISVRTRKTDNEDIDVTKGVYIICHISSLPQTKIMSQAAQRPHIIEIEQTTLFIYAGAGLGIIKKAGLKVKPNYPAINPVPLSMIKTIAENLLSSVSPLKQNIYIYVEIEKGEELAKETANPKIGILGGLSIIGTTGIVKPTSNEAYLETIKTYISVAKANRCLSLIYTLGNTAHTFAEKHFAQTNEMVIEIGNFIYKSLEMLKRKPFIDLYLILSLGKMTKLAQENKNTHMHYGVIDMDKLKGYISHKYPAIKEKLDKEDINTTKRLVEYLDTIDKEITNDFYHIISKKALDNVIKWSYELALSLKTIHIILLIGKNKTIMKTQNL